jgi:hypothetical protein
MLLYVLPFVILLVVAIILKKREASKDAEPSKKSTAVRSKPKAVSTSSSEVTETIVAPSAPLVAAEKSELAPELRRHIENQMRDGNYFAAEAQINQALNRDNGQHELYLMLLDLHLLQNDEFAINQLFTHLRSLQLDDILAQAQAKREAHEQKLAQEAKHKAEAQAAQLAANSVSFDQLQQQVTAKPQAPLEFKQPEVAPSTAAQPLEFTGKSSKVETTEPQPLEFKTTTTAQPEVKTETKPLDFAFNLEQPASATPVEKPAVKTQTPSENDHSLDFSFTPSGAAEISQPSKPQTSVEQAPAKKSLDFDFVIPQVEPVKSTAQAELEQPATQAQQALEFSLDPATPEPTIAPVQAKPQDFEFNLEPTKVDVTPPVVKIAATQAQPDNNDPLLQIFPTLGQINEADLNLRLASEYIRLGAYQDAKALLAEQETSYNEQQRQMAHALRNKIA